MDSSSPIFDPTPVFPNGHTTTHKHHSHIPAVLFLLVGIIVILCIGFGAFALTHPRTVGVGNGIVPNGYEIFLQSKAFPYQPVISIDTSHGTAQSYTVVGQGTATLIGVAISGTSTPYYLISDPQLKVSNLYAGNAKNPKVGLAQLTNSQTFKYDLSYDPSSGVAAYVVSTNASSTNASSTAHVIVYSPLTKKETDLGAGTEPTVLAGGTIVIAREGGSVVAVGISSGKISPLVVISPTAPFAVDTMKNVLALYNPASKSIQYFSIASKVSASYASSVKITTVPVALVFVNHSLLMTYFSIGGTAEKPQPGLMLQYVGTSTQEPITFPAKVAMPVGSYRLTVQM